MGPASALIASYCPLSLRSWHTRLRTQGAAEKDREPPADPFFAFGAPSSAGFCLQQAEDSPFRSQDASLGLQLPPDRPAVKLCLLDPAPVSSVLCPSCPEVSVASDYGLSVALSPTPVGVLVSSITHPTISLNKFFLFKKAQCWDFSCSPVAKTSTAGGTDSIRGWGMKIPHAL
ncbi:unnamed protein product [Rangifer tarandus platyrhynchus]|uniref:Uncharacterized protein n=1 Tax=Rangifer tarandus platyrhynchus TaxID=3082113 RepID=A0AC60A5S5_RANTA